MLWVVTIAASTAATGNAFDVPATFTLESNRPRRDPIFDEIELERQLAMLARERKERHREFVASCSPPPMPEVLRPAPPARAFVARRSALRSSARGVRNWRRRDG